MDQRYVRLVADVKRYAAAILYVGESSIDVALRVAEDNLSWEASAVSFQPRRQLVAAYDGETPMEALIALRDALQAESGMTMEDYGS